VIVAIIVHLVERVLTECGSALSDLPNISGTVEARNFIFGRRWTAVSTNEKINAKLGRKGSCEGYVTYFWSCGIP